MKKFLKIFIYFFITACCISSCTTVWEDVWIEHIPRPVVEIDTITVPPWDEREVFNIR